MAVTIKGIRITSLTVSRDDEGAQKVTCAYQILTTEDRVLAKQSLGGSGYGETPFTPAPDTVKALAEAVALYRRDVESTLGF